MPDKLSSDKVRTGATTTSAPDIQARPKPTRTIVSETHSSDGSYEIVYSDGSVEAGSPTRP